MPPLFALPPRNADLGRCWSSSREQEISVTLFAFLLQPESAGEIELVFIYLQPILWNPDSKVIKMRCVSVLKRVAGLLHLSCSLIQLGLLTLSYFCD